MDKVITTSDPVRTITAKEFLGILETDIGKMIDAGLHYLAFVIICQAIELIGAFYDTKSFDKRGLSEVRFKNGLKRMPARKRQYHQRKSDLYERLRGPLVHQVRPQRPYWLTSVTHDGVKESDHLREAGGEIPLVIEALYADFRQACTQVREDIEKPDSGIPKEKAFEAFMDVRCGSVDFMIPSSGAAVVVNAEPEGAREGAAAKHQGKRGRRRAERRKKGWVEGS